MPVLTAGQFYDWEQFYDQDPWGGEREDWRAMAKEITRNDPDTEVTMVYPYFDDGEDAETRQAAMEKQRKTLDPEEIATKFKASREAYLKGKKSV